MNWDDPPPSRRERQAARLWGKRRHGCHGERTDRARMLAAAGRRRRFEMPPPGIFIQIDDEPFRRESFIQAAMREVPIVEQPRSDGRVLSRAYRPALAAIHRAVAPVACKFHGLPSTDRSRSALRCRVADVAFHAWENADCWRPGPICVSVEWLPDPLDPLAETWEREGLEPRRTHVEIRIGFPDLCYADPDHPFETTPDQGPDETRESYLARLYEAYRLAEKRR